MRSIELFDELKETLGISSDYALAKELGVNKQTISNARKMNTRPDVYMIFRAAELLKRDPIQMLAETQIDGERNENKRAFWKRKLSEIGMIAALVGSATFTLPTDGKAAVNQAVNAISELNAVSIMRLLRKLLSQLRRTRSPSRQTSISPA